MTDKRMVAALIVTILVILMFRQVDGAAFDSDNASCKSGEYCPAAWAVKRQPDGSPLTCKSGDPSKKCPQPYMCVFSQCGLSFCCATEKNIAKMKKEQEEKEDIEEIDADDDEEL
uniref:Uncharacterized protein n=1 Tax=Plectus sambesii TaxID=2011161 RepID=A0A914WT18_9BILA